MPEIDTIWRFDGGAKVKVISYYDGKVIVEAVDYGSLHKVDPKLLTQVKTERERAVEEMARAIAKRHVVETGDHYDMDRFLCYADELYTDGYRKVES